MQARPWRYLTVGWMHQMYMAPGPGLRTLLPCQPRRERAAPPAMRPPQQARAPGAQHTFNPEVHIPFPIDTLVPTGRKFRRGAGGIGQKIVGNRQTRGKTGPWRRTI